MKLSHLALTSFRSAVDLNLELKAPRILIAGVNGVGKTNVREAIRWALTGRCEGTDGKGAGAEVLIPEGAKSAEVVCTVDGIGPVARTFNERGGGTMAVFGWTGTSQIQQQALYGRLNTIPQYVDAVLNTDVFLRLGHAEAKALILGLLNVRIQVGDKSYTLDELDTAYKLAFEDRKVAKKVLAGSIVPPAPVAVPMPPIAAIEGQLAKLRTALGDQQKAIGATLAERTALQQELGAAGARLSQATMRAVGRDHADEIAAAEAQLRALEAAVSPVVDAPTPAATDPARVAFLRSKAEACAAQAQRVTIGGASAGCVLDRDIPCLTAFGAFDGRAQGLAKEMKAAGPAKPTPPPTDNPVTVARKALSLLEVQQRQHILALQDVAEVTASLPLIRARLDGLPTTTEQEAEIVTLQGRIQKGEQLLRDARAHEQAVLAYQSAVEHHKARQADVDRLEALVDELGPKGARAKALSEAMGRFQDAVNPYVEPFGWKISFSVEPWEVYANKRPVETYSKSERYRIGIALQLGIAMLSGMKFAIVDEIDMLDVANRTAMSTMLMAAPLDQILVIGTREVTQKLVVQPGMQSIRLEKKDGRTRVAEVVMG
jgi:hypothetical protein